MKLVATRKATHQPAARKVNTTFLRLVAFWNLLRNPIPAPARFTGTCGDDNDTSLKPYDDLTPAEHDAIGGLARWIIYGKGTGE